MDISEAIKHLETLKSECGLKTEEQALEMAIEALKAEEE